MKMLHRTIAVSLSLLTLSLLSVAASRWAPPQDSGAEDAGQVAEFTPLDPGLTEGELAEMGAEALALVKEGYETELESTAFRFATAEELADILTESNLGVFARTLPEGTKQEEVEAASRRFANGISGGLLAKFNFGANEVLVNLDVFFALQDEFGLEGFASYEVLEAVLVHEAVHAIDDVEFSLSKLQDLIVDTDSAQAINAVMEGHAQFRSRRVCAENGLTAAFERYSEVIAWAPEKDDPAEALLLATQAAQMEFWYEEGERFFSAVHAVRGAEGLREVFRAPPTESVLISEPDWYLDPSTRPEADFDLEARLDVIIELMEREGRDMLKMKLLKPQVAAAFALLPELDVETVLEELDDNHVAIHQGAEDLSSVGIFSMSSAVWSRTLFELQGELLHAKDDAMKEGSVRIVSSEYEEFQAGHEFGAAIVGDFEGILSKKLMDVGSIEVGVASLVAVQGRTVIEISVMEGGEAGSQERLVFLANLLLDPDMAESMLVEINERYEERIEAELHIRLPEARNAEPDIPREGQQRPAIEIPQGVDQVGADGAVKGAPPRAYGVETAWRYSLGQVPEECMEELESGEREFIERPLYSTRGVGEVGAGDRSVLQGYLRNVASRMGRSADSSAGEGLGLANDPLFIRADGHSLFKYTQIVMEECAAPDVRIWKIQMAIAGGRALTLHLSQDPAAAEPLSSQPEPAEIVLSVVQEGSLVDVTGERSYDIASDDFYTYDETRELSYRVGSREYKVARRLRARMKSRLRKEEDLAVVLKPGPGVLTQEVLEVYDALLDAGVPTIYFAKAEEE